MKKTFAIIMILACCFMVTACDKNEDNSSIAYIIEEEIVQNSITSQNNNADANNIKENSNIVDNYGQQADNETVHTHNYSKATCTTARKCSCGATEGEALGHNYNAGVCTICNSSDPNYKEENRAEVIREDLIANVKTGTYEKDAETPYYWINIGKYQWDTGVFLTQLVYIPATDNLQIKHKSSGYGVYEETTMPLFICSGGVAKKDGQLGISHKIVTSLYSYVATAEIDKENYRDGSYIECRWHTDRGGAIYEEEKRVEFSEDITSNVKTALRHLQEWLNGNYTMYEIGFESY